MIHRVEYRHTYLDLAYDAYFYDMPSEADARVFLRWFLGHGFVPDMWGVVFYTVYDNV